MYHSTLFIRELSFWENTMTEYVWYWDFWNGVCDESMISSHSRVYADLVRTFAYSVYSFIRQGSLPFILRGAISLPHIPFIIAAVLFLFCQYFECQGSFLIIDCVYVQIPGSNKYCRFHSHITSNWQESIWLFDFYIFSFFTHARDQFIICLCFLISIIRICIWHFTFVCMSFYNIEPEARRTCTNNKMYIAIRKHRGIRFIHAHFQRLFKQRRHCAR